MAPDTYALRQGIDHLPGQVGLTNQEPGRTVQKKKKNRRFSRQERVETVNPRAVVNLTNQALTDEEHLLLQKGLNFVPTPAPLTELETRIEFLEFERRVRLKHYFRDSEDLDQCPTSFRIPSSFTPLLGQNKTLDKFLTELEGHIITISQFQFF